MTDKTEEKEEKSDDNTVALLQGEALLAFYAMSDAQEEEDHQDGCPCCLQR